MINVAINYFNNIVTKILSFVSTVFMKIDLSLKGIYYTNGIFFYGRAKFVKSKNSKIVIGGNCRFRSKATSNLIGINRPCIISSIGKNSEIIIGANCGFSGTVIGCFSKISIGDNTLCGANTLITDGDWHPDDPRSNSPKPIFIEPNVWLGVNVTVLKGVTIGKNAIIGAGSVVTKNIPQNAIAAGNPCKVLRIMNES